MSESKSQKQRTIPEFANREEEAEFWDTHDIMDYWDELKPVKVKFSNSIDHAVIVSFDLDTFNELLGLARERGIFVDALIQTWIVERMKEVAAAQEVQATAPDSRNRATSSAE